MPRAYFVIPGDIGQPTGGYGYDRKVLEHAGAAGLDLTHLAIPGGYPTPSDADLRETAQTIVATPRDAVLLMDGLAYGAMPADLIRSFDRRIVELCHHPLALEPGIPREAEAHLRRSETSAMALAQAVIVTGDLTARILCDDFGVAPERISVAHPGTDPAQRSRGSGQQRLNILAVGSVIPRKGYADLVAAMALLKSLDWTLEIAGSTVHALDTVAEVQNQIHAAGLGERILLRGALNPSQLEQAYDRADLFVVSSHYEGYGMAVAEAMARGLPIVATRAGAVAYTLDDRAGLKVPVGSIQELAEAIQTMLLSSGKRKVFSDGSWLSGQSLPRWSDTVATIRDVLSKVTP